MSFFIKLDEDMVIDLPEDLDTKGRMEFCQKVIDMYPQYFEQVLAKYCSNNETAENKVKRRLEIMANYIISSSTDDKKYPILSSYKEKRNDRFEVRFSELEYKYDNFE